MQSIIGFTHSKTDDTCRNCEASIESGELMGWDNRYKPASRLCYSCGCEAAAEVGQSWLGPKQQQQKSGSAKASPRLNAGNESDSRSLANSAAQKQLKQIEAEALDHISDHLDAFDTAISERMKKLEQEITRKADQVAGEITMSELRLTNAVRATMDAHIGQILKRVEEQVSGYVMALGTLEFRLKEHVAVIEGIRDKVPAPVIKLPSLEVES